MRLWFTAAAASVLVLALVWETKAQDAISYEANGDWMQEANPNARADYLSGAQQIAGNPVDISAAASNTRRRRRHKKKKRQRQQQNNDENDEDYYYDRDDNYGAPKAPAATYDAPAPSYNPPAPSYSPPAYSPPSYAAPSDGYGAPAYDDGGGGGGGYDTAVVTTGDEDVVDQTAMPFTDYEYYDSYGPQYEANPKQEENANPPKRKSDGFNDFLNALAAFLPIGLFLAAIPPNIITINSKDSNAAAAGYDSSGYFGQFQSFLSTILPIGLFIASLAPSTVTITGRKKRGLNDLDTDDEEIEKYTFPFMTELQSMGYDKLKDPACQKQLFCKMAAFGGEEKGANYVQKSFHYVSTLFPAFLARPVGLDDVFGAVQNHHCESFNCKL